MNTQDARPFNYVLKTLICICLASISAISAAETFGPFAIVDSRPISELWLNPGFYSYHFQSHMGFNDNNLGIGGEYRYSTTSSVVAGNFHNSDWQKSYYAGWYWRPLALGPVSLGAVVGGIDGYPAIRGGGWFAAVAPVASFEYKNIGANMIFIPEFKDGQNRLYGSLSLQLKVKVY